MKVSLIVPTWNEIDGMRAIMPRINKDWVDEIVVVDGGSTDGTIEYAKENGYTVHVQKNPGMRQAYLEVLPVARGDIWITFSPDGNSVPVWTGRRFINGTAIHGYFSQIYNLRFYHSKLVADFLA